MKIFKWVPVSSLEQTPVSRPKLVVSAERENDSNSNGSCSNPNKENLNEKANEKATVLSTLIKEDSTMGFSENSLDESSAAEKMDTSNAPTNGVSNSVLNGENSSDAQFPDDSK